MDNMVEATAHRGPDGQQTKHFQFGEVHMALGHNRLAIQNKEDEASQPISDSNSRYWMVFNGEIYNHAALRKILTEKGTQFRTHSDTEVLLQWLIRFGAAKLHELEGIFSCIFLDVETKDVLVFRDRWGVKPLFFYATDNGIIFSSEVSGILQSGLGRPDLNLSGVKNLLRHRYLPEGETMYQEVFEVPAGKVGLWHTSSNSIQWDSMAQKSFPVPTSLKQALAEAVDVQLQAAVPVGIMLSGGVDSTLLAVIARQELQTKPICFSIATERSEDQIWAQKAAEKLNMQLETIFLGPSDFQDFLQFSASLSQPVPDPAVWLTYRLCKRAKELGVKALLSGAGADELFGGYRRHQAFAWYFLLRKSHLWPVFKKLLPLVAPLAGQKIGHILGQVSNNPADTFKQMSGNQFPEFKDPFAQETEAADFNMSAALAFDQQYYLKKDVLVTADLGGMMAGVEVRVPFLDSAVVNWAQHNYPSAAELRKQTKPALKSLLHDMGLPAFANRKKAGFGVPIDSWMQHPNNQMLVKELVSSQSQVAEMLGFNVCNQVLNAHGSPMEKAALVMVEGWLRGI